MQNFRSGGVEPLFEYEARQFLRHAARVRSLSLRDDDFHLLSGLTIETCIFPRLLLLKLELHRPIRNFHVFLSPTLLRFECRLPPNVNSDLESIATRCPALEVLSIAFWTNPVDELFLWSNTVCLYKQLVSLRCPPLDWTAWKHLSTLPTLLKVHIWEPMDSLDTEYFPLDHHNLTFSPFLNVTALYFSLETSIAYVITVMQHSEFPSHWESPITPCLGQRLSSFLLHCHSAKDPRPLNTSTSSHLTKEKRYPFWRKSSTAH